jgi:hypothetical protein
VNSAGVFFCGPDDSCAARVGMFTDAALCEVWLVRMERVQVNLLASRIRRNTAQASSTPRLFVGRRSRGPACKQPFTA